MQDRGKPIRLKQFSVIALGCASTGLAAKNYDEFDTAHGLFIYPVIEDMEDIVILMI